MLSISTEEMKNFKSVFNGNSRVLEFYRGLYANPRKKYNHNRLRESNKLIIDLNLKLKKLISLIDDIESLGKDMSDVRKIIENIMTIKSNVIVYSKLENLYRALNNQYGRYINLKKILFTIKDETDLTLKEDNLNFCIDFFLKELNSLKNSDTFINDDFSKYIGDFYLVGFELMMREFLILGESRLYNYFSYSNHDIKIISGLIESQIDFLWDSQGIYGLNELERIIDKNKVLFNRDVIVQLIICMYPKVVFKLLIKKMVNFRDRLKVVYSSFKDYSIKYQKSKINFIKYINISRKLSKDYNAILKEYKDFTSSYQDKRMKI